MSVLAGHEHVYLESGAPDAVTLLLLHGTGANEYDLLDVGRMLLPDANLLSPRGTVLENGMPRFFKRHGEGVLDLDDLKERAGLLGDFVDAAGKAYGFDASRLVAFGFSNGANAATGLLLTKPRAVASAVLARAMPFDLAPAAPDVADGVRVQLLAGRQDPYTRSPLSERLAGMLEDAGARVDVHWEDAGHGLTQGDVTAAREWLAEAPGVRA